MLRAAAIVSVIAASTIARAAPCPTDAHERADALRAHLDREARRAHRWDLGWGALFGVATVGYAAMADTRWEFGLSLDQGQVDDLWAGAVKGGIATASHIVLPLHVERVPAATADPCADLAAAQHAIETTATNESRAFWLSIVGGVLLNGGGLLYVGLRDHAWGTGAISMALGVPIAIAHAWTAPHASRRALAEGRLDGPPATWQIDAAITPGFTGLVLSGSF